MFKLNIVMAMLLLVVGFELLAATQPTPRPATRPQVPGRPAVKAPAKIPQKAAPAPPAPAHTARARAFEATCKDKPASIYGDSSLIPSETAMDSVTPGVSEPGFVSGQMFHTAISGQNGESHAEASVAELELDIGLHHISASYIAGRADAYCERNGAATYVYSEIVNLVVDGRPVPAPRQANQRIWWKDGYLSLNEQAGNTKGSEGSYTVVALRVVLNNGDTVVIGRAEAGINCRESRACETDFIYGSGWVNSSVSGGRLNLAIALGKNRDGITSGHFVMEDSRNNMRFSSQGAETFVRAGNGSMRQITGEGTLNGRPGVKYRMELTDGGNSNDKLVIFLSSGYMTSGFLQAGGLHLVPCR